HDPRLTAVLLTDPGCWHQRQMEHVVSDGMQVLVPPDGGRRPDIRSGWTGGFYDFMRRALSTDAGRDRHRQIAIEPVFDRI
ncbi:MAG TPA: hypothetical protein VNT55_12870, partial [Baekduia sp.]|nr:hypothetical protein [Baekduia sp.]